MKDLDALDEVAALMQRFSAATRAVDAPGVLDEFRRTILAELDYREEAAKPRGPRASAPRLRAHHRPAADRRLHDRARPDDGLHRREQDHGGQPVEWTEVDGGVLGDDSVRAYLQQILGDGVFHADPHPGNVLLTPDSSAALIDLGMVGRLSSAMQEQLFR
jgi:ubiquinone biosynthesis protein